MEQKTDAKTERYDAAAVEKKWQERWADDGLYTTDLSAKAEKWYALTMLPYTSGELHVGHWYADGAFGHGGALPADARQERLLPDRLRRLRPAGGERSDPARHPPPHMDVREHRPDARTAEEHGRDVRLVSAR